MGSSSQAHVPSEADLESFVPSLPTGWATGGVESVVKKSVAAASAPTKAGKSEKEGEQKKRRRHKLPKGAVEGRAFTEDVSRKDCITRFPAYNTARPVDAIEAACIVHHCDEQEEGPKSEHGYRNDSGKYSTSGCVWRRGRWREEEEGEEVVSGCKIFIYCPLSVVAPMHECAGNSSIDI